ncbi:MAG: DNA-directed RNA polymerase subunit beta [Berkelbacteria bacterium GW2011_GWB1_38_5]|uniref:DNA-directed RNA polymerase subunit beta n=1 Tax=Berkelbacteria bacterium GW2011_GWB1_38_5 TaxID=1618336 RepID=A0A0G0KE38_9BACT|nr:MAG: DNA-directed RNA polymerase subunit beta [Berkelbacteria bacterium GW2011_GWB1_38_5]
MATYAKVNEYGFLETPYLVVEQKDKKTRVTSKVVYLDADEEEKAIIVPVSAKIDKDNYLVESKTIVRKYGEPQLERISKAPAAQVMSI